MRSPRRLKVVLVVLALAVTACGDDSPEATPNQLPILTTSTPADLARSEPFCELARAAAMGAATFDQASATPVEIESYYRDQLTLIDDALLVVPEPLAADLAIQRSVLAATIELLEGAAWDPNAAIDGLTPLYEAEDYRAADARLATYDSEVCGIESIDVVPGDPPGEAEPVDVPAEIADYCEAAFSAAQADGLAPDAGPDDARAYYEGLVARLDGLRQLAPPELAADLELIRANFNEVVSILAGVEWDLEVGFPLVEEWAAGVSTAEAMDAAIGRVEEFDRSSCGIV